MDKKKSDKQNLRKIGARDVWGHVVSDLQISVGRLDFESLVKKLRLVRLESVGGKEKAVLGCVSIFQQKQVEKRILGQIAEAFSRVVGKSIDIEFVVGGVGEEVKEEAAGPLFAPYSINKGEEFKRVLKRVGLKEELSLKNFAVSSSNEMAYAAAKAVSQNPGKAYNPLFLYGGVGVGKTHLMQGVGQEILKSEPDLRLIYCSGEEFTNEIIEAIQQKSTPSFRKRYRSVGLLLIDDIQFIAGKAAVQEEFFHTFNAIAKEGGQIILTSDKPAKEIDRLEERLRSRFEGGLTIDIGEPNFELRSAIVMIKAEQLGLDLSTEAAQVIATPETDTRALLGALMRAVAVSKSRKGGVSVEVAKEVVKKMSKSREAERVELKPERLISGVSSYFNVEVAEVMGKRRNKSFTTPRHVAMYLLKVDFELGYVEIGRYFSNRDHTSVMHAVQKVTGLAKEGGGIGGELDRIRKELYQ